MRYTASIIDGIVILNEQRITNPRDNLWQRLAAASCSLFAFPIFGEISITCVELNNFAHSYAQIAFIGV